MGEATSDKKLHIARVAANLAAELAGDAKDVDQVLKPIQTSLANGQGDAALAPAVQTLAAVARRRTEATFRFNPIIPLNAVHMGKDAAGRAAWVARESLPHMTSAGNATGEAYANLLAVYAYIELADTRRALDHASVSQDCFKKQKDKAGEAAALSAAAGARLRRACAGVSPQLQLVEEKEEKSKLVKARQEGEAKAAIAAARDACCIYNDLDDRLQEANCLNLVGELLLAKDDVDEAKNVARESRDIFQDLEDAAGEARSLNVILSANMLHEADFVDALFAAKDVIWLFRGNEISPEEEDKKAIADALHAQAKVHLSVGELKEAQEAAQEAIKYYEQATMTPKEGAYGLGGALQTLAHALCLEGEPDLGRPHNERAAELFATAQDAPGEAMARAVMGYQDTMSRMKQLEDAPGAFTEQSNQQVTDNWTVMDEAMALMRELRNQEGEDQIGSLIYEMNQKVGELQKKMSTPTRTVWTVDRITRKAVQKDYYDDPAEPEKKAELEDQKEEDLEGDQE